MLLTNHINLETTTHSKAFNTQQALVENQYQLALQVDNAFREISKLEKAILSAAYQEGERTVKCLKKNPGWASIPEGEAKKMFRKHLSDLGASSTPAVDVIRPKSGKSPFLKVTFMTGGEKREFNTLNKASPNKYESKTLTPQSVLPYQKEMEKTVANRTVDWLKNAGYMVHDKDVRLLCLNSTWLSESLSMACLASPGQANHIHL